MRAWVPGVLVLFGVLGAATARVGAQRVAAPPSQQARVGAVEVTLFGAGAIRRTDLGHGRGAASLSWELVTAAIASGPSAVLPVLARGARDVRERAVRVCGVTGRVREQITRDEEMSSHFDDGTSEVTHHPGPAVITLVFDWAGEHYAVTWRVSDYRRRARYRALERRFFASVRCSPQQAVDAAATP